MRETFSSELSTSRASAGNHITTIGVVSGLSFAPTDFHGTTYGLTGTGCCPPIACPPMFIDERGIVPPIPPPPPPPHVANTGWAARASVARVRRSLRMGVVLDSCD